MLHRICLIAGIVSTLIFMTPAAALTIAYKSIIGRDTGMFMPIGITRAGITCVEVTCFPVAAGCSAAGIGRPSACIGRVISGEIESGGSHD
jgi:hypothetical protein